MVSTLQPELKVGVTRKVDNKWNVELWESPSVHGPGLQGRSHLNIPSVHLRRQVAATAVLYKIHIGLHLSDLKVVHTAYSH